MNGIYQGNGKKMKIVLERLMVVHIFERERERERERELVQPSQLLKNRLVSFRNWYSVSLQQNCREKSKHIFTHVFLHYDKVDAFIKPFSADFSRVCRTVEKKATNWIEVKWNEICMTFTLDLAYGMLVTYTLISVGIFAIKKVRFPPHCSGKCSQLNISWFLLYWFFSV
mgnify:CR=1 FL=1